MKSKHILIVDDHPTLREGLRSLLSSQPDFDIVGEAADGQEAIDSVARHHPDLVLMDISMPRMDGIAATREIKRKWPETKILAFTVHNTPEYITATLNAGADGYILKDSTRDKLISSIENILAGKRGTGTEIQEKIG